MLRIRRRVQVDIFHVEQSDGENIAADLHCGSCGMSPIWYHPAMMGLREGCVALVQTEHAALCLPWKLMLTTDPDRCTVIHPVQVDPE